MDSNDIHTLADIDRLQEHTENLNKKISALKENLEGCKKQYDVYSDIAKTYYEITKWDYIGNLIDKVNQQKEHKHNQCGTNQL